MRRASFDDVHCSVAQTLEVVGEWWTPMILRDLFLGVRRFEDFQERLGIARNTLTDRHNALVDHGIVDRVPYQERPVRHEYRLTDKGTDLWHVVTALREWGDRWAAPDGPPLKVTHRDCGGPTALHVACEVCAETLSRRDVTVAPGPGLGPGSPVT